MATNNALKVTLDWISDLNFVGSNERGQRVTFGGEGDYVSPMETLLMSVGGCASIDVVMILQRARQAVSGCRCELVGERFDGTPKRFTAMTLNFVVRGTDLSVKQVTKAIDLSVEKYCSVMHSLDKDIEISTSFEIVPV